MILSSRLDYFRLDYCGKIVKMNNPSAGSSSKQRTGASQPSETSFKRKRGVFQKECNWFSFSSSLIFQRKFVCENVIM